MSFGDVGYSSVWNLATLNNHMKEGWTYPDKNKNDDYKDETNERRLSRQL